MDLEIKLRALLRLALMCSLEKNEEAMGSYLDKACTLVQQAKGMDEERFLRHCIEPMAYVPRDI